MLKQVTPLVLIVAVTACSSPVDRRQANGGDEYTNVKTQPVLTIPAGLNTPVYSKEYKIPKLNSKASASLIGKQLDIRPPLQILPMAEGTRVEEGSDNIKIVVDSIDKDIELKSEMFNVIKDYLASRSIPILNEDYDKGLIETDWIENQEVIDSSFWGSDEIFKLRQRYEFKINIRPHGRSGDLMINLVDHEVSYDGKQKDIVLSGEDKRRYTIDMLNNAVAYMSIKRSKSLKAKRLRESLGIDMSIVKGTSSEVESEEGVASYWLAEAPFKRTWDRLRIVLPELGFEIVDMDSNKGLYYINVTDDSGFWSSLWNDKDLAINEGSYRMTLEDDTNADKTRIYLRDSSDKPLDNEIVEAVYDGFSELMQEDRKIR
ncbi:outer membrane protein assembly factor BamC [Shewanella violacea]|uniref:Outer membrane protein assembly factor BamC n=1 Tax=Shewanella violacea (strain JCM 10179 / CIP 106290 / LMG 19151 / DSS12) TaxID=637905 RepID=D4ZJP0_SHEVD|nr:outer membrane protein assembly factor BamC [Shewanella violacea]BAJ01889.1 lipoprotein-34 NlpB [Shewanella violacea DSS12]